ncbi:hypothetical protein BO79DRAFT_226928 [Aspergillus costaricaensis CBS 115574]|uniref:Uncharacterized protein n=1 Tax=Aspergillus costaricaensis CBS 115574 TaxID=1448317 RepID=A0ACD1IKF5_9EURO|nr:hypothetical protein BO79DRAFT_226928 [Aspergillus costaricaensis CBS 115574]RAK90590.1 hypothetical protein BO79DRAFT_226928 [Aspergillus costaricaensis CBS 115574]
MNFSGRVWKAILWENNANLIDRHCGSNFTIVRVQHKRWAGKPRGIQETLPSIPASLRSCLYSNDSVFIPAVFVTRIKFS